PPLRAIRADAAARGSDPVPWLLGLVLAIGVGAFAWMQTADVRAAVGFPVGVAVAFGLLALTAKLVQALVRRLVPRGWPYVWRQGLANLHRPGNQTLVLLLTLGLGTFLLMTLTTVERSLLAPLAIPGEAGGRPDVILFDIQADQRAEVAALVEEQGLAVLDEAPIVPMKLTAIEGVGIEEIRTDSTRDVPTWALTREYRSTIRDRLVDTETLVAGTFVGSAPADTAVVPISFDEELAADLGLGLGDRITWSVSGREVASEITSLRRIDWARVAPNFFVVFPEGPLDDAPQFGILATRAGSPEASARLQRAAVERFPNISVVDVSQILDLIEGVLD